MKKTLLLLALTALTISQVSNAIIARDSTAVGPGVVYYHDEIEEGGPWNFDILKIDMSNPYIQLESVKAKDNLFSFEVMSSASKRYDKEGHRIVGAINGDFYNTGTGEPTGIQIVNNELIYEPNSRVAFAMDEYKKPLIDIFDYSAALNIIKDTALSVTNLNSTYSAGKTIMYNSFFGTTTGTPSGTTEISVRPVNGWVTNSPTKCVVTKVSSSGNASLSRGYAVIAGTGAAALYLNKAKASDTVTVTVSVKPSKSKLTQAIGGNVRLVTDGVPNSENADRHPRTAIGFSKDSLTVYFITVDGRQPGWSVGMSYYELGKYMKDKWNIYQGINVDGGGSTTMVVRGEVKNRPSDGGGERTVSNGMFVVSTAPTGPFSRLSIFPNKVYLIKGASAKFSAKSYDEYYNPITVSGQTITWRCDAGLGKIDASGNLTTDSLSVNGYVYASAGSVTDSVLVRISNVQNIYLTPDPVVLQSGEVQAMNAKAYDSYGNPVGIQNRAFTWIVEGNAGTITNEGVFTAGSGGEGIIIARYQEAADTVTVKVGVEQFVILDDFSGAKTYTITGTKVNLNECSFTIDHTKYVSVPTSGRLDYSLATGGTSTLNLNCNVPLSGSPDAIGIHIYGDGNGHWLRSEFKDKNGNKFLLDITPETPGVDWVNEWKYVEIPLSKAVPSWANPSAVLTFPITLNRLYLAEPKETKKDKGSLLFDDLQVHFIATGVDDNKTGQLPEKFMLEQNFPNPFNPETTINYSLPQESVVDLSIYDIRGAKIRTLAKGYHKPGNFSVRWNASDMSSGVYFYRLITDRQSISRKMQLIK